MTQFVTTVCLALLAADPHPMAAPGVTSLTNSDVEYSVQKEPTFLLERAGVKAVIVTNEAVDTKQLPGHRAGYNGVASLTHKKRAENLFVPTIAGLNFEHIHDGTMAVSKEKFEPRKWPMELRRINRFTVELYQSPTPNWKLESCGRYEILRDGAIKYTFECIPRADLFHNKTIGLFWASYIHAPESRWIHFRGRRRGSIDPSRWIMGVTPSHGVDSTHPPSTWQHKLDIDPKFPLTLVNHPSKFEYTSPWYYGVSHGMAYVQMFRKRDQIWLAQSPTGGGVTNPAWDFQWFIPDYKVGEAYGFKMRAAYLPYESRDQIIKATKLHRDALER
ncbi:MAG: hypothetical protein CMJ78_19805 [Planctomycetaceae bacterium]|nr:hypothetical protein [Planctomycetaceae bacterium]